jgi:hypothetical protein
MGSGNNKNIIDIPLNIGIDQLVSDESRKGASICENMKFSDPVGRATKDEGYEDVSPFPSSSLQQKYPRTLVATKNGVWVNYLEYRNTPIAGFGNEEGIRAVLYDPGTDIGADAGFWSHCSIEEVTTTSKNLNINVNESTDSDVLIASTGELYYITARLFKNDDEDCEIRYTLVSGSGVVLADERELFTSSSTERLTNLRVRAANNGVDNKILIGAMLQDDGVDTDLKYGIISIGTTGVISGVILATRGAVKTDSTAWDVISTGDGTYPWTIAYGSSITNNVRISQVNPETGFLVGASDLQSISGSDLLAVSLNRSKDEFIVAFTTDSGGGVVYVYEIDEEGAYTNSGFVTASEVIGDIVGITVGWSNTAEVVNHSAGDWFYLLINEKNPTTTTTENGGKEVCHIYEAELSDIFGTSAYVGPLYNTRAISKIFWTDTYQPYVFALYNRDGFFTYYLKCLNDANNYTAGYCLLNEGSKLSEDSYTNDMNVANLGFGEFTIALPRRLRAVQEPSLFSGNSEDKYFGDIPTIKVDFGNRSISNIKFGKSAIVSGPKLAILDSVYNKYSQYGFLRAPDTAIESSTDDPLIADGVHKYKVYFEHVDGEGNIHRSPPSEERTVVINRDGDFEETNALQNGEFTVGVAGSPAPSWTVTGASTFNRFSSTEVRFYNPGSNTDTFYESNDALIPGSTYNIEISAKPSFSNEALQVYFQGSDGDPIEFIRSNNVYTKKITGHTDYQTYTATVVATSDTLIFQNISPTVGHDFLFDYIRVFQQDSKLSTTDKAPKIRVFADYESANNGRSYIAKIYRNSKAIVGDGFRLIDTLDFTGCTTASLTYIDNLVGESQAKGNEPFPTDWIDFVSAAPCAQDVAETANRLWVSRSDNKSQLWYSKPKVRGYAYEFDETQVIDFGELDNIVAISRLRNQLVVFKERSIWAVYGRGPNGFGGGAPFEPQLLSDNIEVQPNTILEMIGGLIFNTSEGWYMLGVSGGLSRINFGPSGELSGPITTIPNHKLKQHIFLTSGDSLVYDHITQQWSVLDLVGSNTVVGGDSYNGETFICQEDEANNIQVLRHSDTNITGVAPVYETAWIHISPAHQNLQRVSECYLFGVWTSASKPKITVYQNYDESTPAQVVNIDSWESQGTKCYARFSLSKQQCSAVRFKIEQQSAANTDEFALNSIMLEVADKVRARPTTHTP